MGRSLRAAALDVQTRSTTPASSAFQALGSQFLVEHDNDKVRHRRNRLENCATRVATMGAAIIASKCINVDLSLEWQPGYIQHTTDYIGMAAA